MSDTIDAQIAICMAGIKAETKAELYAIEDAAAKVKSLLLRERLEAKVELLDGIMMRNGIRKIFNKEVPIELSDQTVTAVYYQNMLEQELSRLSGEESHE